MHGSVHRGECSVEAIEWRDCIASSSFHFVIHSGARVGTSQISDIKEYCLIGQE